MSANVDLCEPTSAPDLAGMAAPPHPRPRVRYVGREEGRALVRLECPCGYSQDRLTSLGTNLIVCPECESDFMAHEIDYGVSDEDVRHLNAIVSRALYAYQIINPAQPRNTAPQSAAEGNGVSADAETTRPSPLGGDHSSPSVPLCLSASVPSSSSPSSSPPSGAPVTDDRSKANGLAAPSLYYSCRCNKIRRGAATEDRCPGCDKPLTIHYINGRPVDPNIQVRWVAILISDTITRLRTIIDDHRPHLSLADVSSALRTIDEARALIKLHDLGETPLVMPRDYGSCPSTLSSPRSPLSTPEGT